MGKGGDVLDIACRLATALAACGLLAGVVRAAEPAGYRPFFDARKHATRYAGPDREEPLSAVDAVRIAYFGPGQPDHPRFGDLWKAAAMAIDQANRQGGYRGKPFRLVAVWSDNPWGTGVGRLARLAYQQHVFAIIGGVDGATAHLAEQVVAKARLPLVSPVATDATVNLANVPWVFSVAPPDNVLAAALAAEIAEQQPVGRLVLITADDHDSRLLAAAVKRALVQRALGVAYEHTHPAGDEDVAPLVRRVLDVRPGWVLVLAGAEDSARLIAALRAGGFSGTVLAGPAAGCRRFLKAAGAAAEGVVFPLLYAPSETDRFAEAFRRRYGYSPDYRAACTFDAVKLTVAAIRKAGLNRARIGDAIRQLAPWPGVAGPIRWDALGANTRPVPLAAVAGGKWVPRKNRASSTRAEQAHAAGRRRPSAGSGRPQTPRLPAAPAEQTP